LVRGLQPRPGHPWVPLPAPPKTRRRHAMPGRRPLGRISYNSRDRRNAILITLVLKYINIFYLIIQQGRHVRRPFVDGTCLAGHLGLHGREPVAGSEASTRATKSLA